MQRTVKNTNKFNCKENLQTLATYGELPTNIELADFSQLLDYEYAFGYLNDNVSDVHLNDIHDVEEEIYRNVIRKQGKENHIAGNIANEVKPLECIPMLLQDVLRLDAFECSGRGGTYHAFGNQIHFRTLIVWARMVTPLKSIGSNNQILCCEIDDGTAKMPVRYYKNEYSINALQALRIRLNHENDDKSLAKHLHKLLEKTERLLDYSNLQQNQWILIYGHPSCFHKNINIHAYTILADNNLKCNISDFEIAFKTKLLNWYLNNVPRCMHNN